MSAVSVFKIEHVIYAKNYLDKYTLAHEAKAAISIN